MKNHWKKLINVLRVLVLVYEIFFRNFLMEKEQKKQLIFFTVFYISYESNIKFFLK